MDIGAITISEPQRSPSDGARQLTRAIARGDTSAFTRLHDAWFDRALALAKRLTRRDEAFCLDVVQDTMIRAARKIPELQSLEQVDAWMGRVVHRVALDRLRAERRRAQHELEAAAIRHHKVETPLDPELTERIAWVLAELSRMDERERTLVQARFARGKPIRKLGEEINTTGDAGHGLLRRTLARLRTRAREQYREELGDE